MKRWMAFAAALLLPLAASAQKAKSTAAAELKDAQGRKAGTARFKETRKGVTMAVKAKGLTAGEHAIHIHEAGRCEPPDFKTAGAHFNPHGKQHGSLNPQGEHAGDLGNLKAPASGTVKAKLNARGVTLGAGEHSLFHPGGTSLVIHASPDDLKTDPSGNAGARILCGVITRQ